MLVNMTGTARAAAGSRARRERAERILDAAAESLRRHGYRRVSIDDVAGAAGVGKGTIYLHWKTREALFWAALQREAMRLLEDLVARLDADPRLALPDRLMPAIYVAVGDRPLVRALLTSDAEVLGALAADQEVAAAQREFAGNPDYLGLLAARGLLRDGLTPKRAGKILGRVMAGFFAVPAGGDGGGSDGGDGKAAGGSGGGEDGELLAEVMARTLMPDPPYNPDAVAAVGADVSGLFRGIIAVQREQLERAY
jgi:AcrR family transcriptional regulator